MSRRSGKYPHTKHAKTCAHLQCKRARTRTGLCRAHMNLMKAGKSIAYPIQCAAKGCRRDDGMSRGYCAAHALRISKYGDPREHISLERRPRNKCTVYRCSVLAVAKGLCKRHYTRKQRTGSVHLRPRAASPTAHPTGRITTADVDREMRRGLSLDQIADARLIHPKALRLWLDQIGRDDLLRRAA